MGKQICPRRQALDFSALASIRLTHSDGKWSVDATAEIRPESIVIAGGMAFTVALVEWIVAAGAGGLDLLGAEIRQPSKERRYVLGDLDMLGALPA